MGAVVGLPNEAVATLPIVNKSTKGNVDFDETDLKEDLDLYRALRPNHKIIGWYSTKKAPLKENLQVTHRFKMNLCSNPIFIELDPEVRADSIDVPVKVYREADGKLLLIDHNLIPDISEKVAVDYSVQAQDAPDMSTEGSIVIDKYQKLASSIQDMMRRINLIQAYLKDVTSRRVEANQEILREIRTLCNRLPIMDRAEFQKTYKEEQKNGKLLRMVSDLTKAHKNLCWTMDSYQPHCENRNHSDLGLNRIDMGMGYGMAHGFC